MKNFHNWACNLWIAYVVFLFFHYLVLFQPLLPIPLNTWPLCYIFILLKSLHKKFTSQDRAIVMTSYGWSFKRCLKCNLNRMHYRHFQINIQAFQIKNVLYFQIIEVQINGLVSAWQGPPSWLSFFTKATRKDYQNMPN